MLKWLQDAPPIQIVFIIGLVVVGGAMVAGVFGDPEPESEQAAAGGTVDDSAAQERVDEIIDRNGDEADDAATPAEPEPTEEPSPAAPVVVEGSNGNTAPFELPGGQLVVSIDTTGDCYFGFDLQTPDGDFYESLPTPGDSGTAEGVLYGLTAGDYYIEPFTGPDCRWTMTFTPQ